MMSARSLPSKLPMLLALAFVVCMLCGQMPRLPRALRSLYVPAMSPSFLDTRTVTHSIDALQHGEDPYVVRTYDPWHRVYNYPPVWLDLRYLGVTSRSTDVLGIVFALLTATCFWLLFTPRRWLAGLLVLLAGISPVIVFAVERGNIDQVVFFLLVVTLLTIAGRSETTRLGLRAQ